MTSIRYALAATPFILVSCGGLSPDNDAGHANRAEGSPEEAGGVSGSGSTVRETPELCACDPFLGGDGAGGAGGGVGSAGEAGATSEVEGVWERYEVWIRPDRSDLMTGMLKEGHYDYPDVYGYIDQTWTLGFTSAEGVVVQIHPAQVVCGYTHYFGSSYLYSVVLYLSDGEVLTGDFHSRILIEGAARDILISSIESVTSTRTDRRICYRHADGVKELP